MPKNLNTPTTVLVTGGAGFIGSTGIERLLAEGHTVICLDSFDSYYDPDIKRRNIASFHNNGRFHLYEGDIRDPEIVSAILRQYPVHYVLHLAARAGVRASLQDPFVYCDVNVKGTLNLLEQVKDRRLTHFVFASSSSVYGNSTNVPFREEDHALYPISPYGVSKRQGELTCSAYSHLYDIPVTCLRYFTVYGPRQRPDMAIHGFVEKIDRGEPIAMFGSGDTSRNYTYVDDIVDGTLRALFTPAPFDIINLGGASTTRLRDMIGLIEKALGKPADIRSLPMQPGDVTRTSADIRKAQHKLDYHPDTDLATGIERFVAWYRNSHGTG